MLVYRIVVYLLFGLRQVVVVVIPQDPGCQDPLGMENRGITDDKFVTTCEHNPGKEPYKARLNGNSAYCTPKRVGTEGFYQNIYLEIDLTDEYKITAFALQGYDKTYGPGKVLRWYTYINSRNKIVYKFNGSENINLGDLKGDNIEYLPLIPTFTSKLRIQLKASSNIHCLRMEIYGCVSESFSEYSECTSGHKGLLSKYHRNMKFTATDAHRAGDQVYGAEKLVFSAHSAWCLMTSSMSKNPFQDWATIDMVEDYLIYGIRVRGFVLRMDAANVDRRRFIAEIFKLQYSLDGKKRRDLEGRKELPTLTYGTMQNFKIPLIARYVYISMKNLGGNLTCIKLELYGCKAVLHDGTVTTSSSPVIPTNTTNPDEARVHRYHIPEGNKFSDKIKWTDSKYDGQKTSDNELDNGIGCLVKKMSPGNNGNPFVSPECWVGWKLNLTAKPAIFITLTRPTKVAGIHLRSYVNRSMGALPIRKFIVFGQDRKPPRPLGSMCSPDVFYKEKAAVIDYYISLNNINLQYLQLEFEYSGDWILVRHFKFIKPGDLQENALKLSNIVQECIIPEPISGKKSPESWQVTVIVIIVLVMLLLVLVAFIIHHYRTSVRKKWNANGAARPSIIVQDQHSSHNDNRGFITSDPSGNKTYTKVQYSNSKNNKKYNMISNVDEDLYDAVDNSFDSGVLSDPQQATYADCEDIRTELYSQQSSHNTPNGTLLYSVPDATKVYAEPNTRQYAEPDTLKRESVVYQGSVIYATTYENPYKATVASSFYAEPSMLNKKGQIKVFPRQQLVFKEKIGVGQFGEVHIAEATGLDEIYGTIGHFNSWGLPDTSLVAVKLLKSVDVEVEKEFMKEVEVMATLKDENVVRLLGVCYEQPKLMVVEYMENGDLNQFLRERRPELKRSRTSQLGPNVLILDQLIHMAQQISAGMKYLHSVGFIHRDLATRNCLVGPAYQVKIADFGMSRYVYTKHYYRVEGKAILPIRWMAPECLYYGKFTVETDVWSFGVTLWEIFSFARESPYSNMTDPQVIEAACEVLQNAKRTFPYLSQPQSCPDDVYELVKKCWTTHPKSRPTFINMSEQLLRKCTISEVDI